MTEQELRERQINKARDEVFKAGIREGVRRAYEDMIALHRITHYNLDACLASLEEKYGKSNSGDK